MRFRINQLSTIATFLITTDDDYMTFSLNNNTVTTTMFFKNIFKNRCYYDPSELPFELNKLLPEGLTCSFNDEGTLTFQSSTSFTIVEATHRAKLLTGLYHTQLPVSGSGIKINSVPYTCYGNTLYLRSRINSVVGFNITQATMYISLCYHVTEIFIPGIPIISKAPGLLTKILESDLSNLEFILVDFMNEPVILKDSESSIETCHGINLRGQTQYIADVQ